MTKKEITKRLLQDKRCRTCNWIGPGAKEVAGVEACYGARFLDIVALPKTLTCEKWERRLGIN
jgi:hypothetical protein